MMAGLLQDLRRRLLDRPKFMAHNPRYAAYAIGEWTYGEPNVLAWGEGATLKIGRFCSIAPRVTLVLVADHRSDWVTTFPFSELWRGAEAFQGHPATKGDIVIGNDVWIGYGAFILSGVTIGDGAVIGAASVVTGDVAPYSIVAGNPARHVRYRFPEATIAALERIAWWDWSESEIRQALPLLLSHDIDRFIATYGKR